MLNALLTLRANNKNKSHYYKESLLPMFTTAHIIRKLCIMDLEATNMQRMSQWVFKMVHNSVKALKG